MSKDYVASFKVGPDDKLDYGTKGMKWGIRKEDSSGSSGKSFSTEEHNGLVKNILLREGRDPRPGDFGYFFNPSEKKAYVAAVASVKAEKHGSNGRTVRTKFVHAMTLKERDDGVLELEWKNENLKKDLKREMKHSDLLHYGIKGMKWGQRRSKAELRAATAKGSGDSDKPAVTKASSGSETSSQKYKRLLAESKKNGANSLSDDDLRFVNARTEAITKINKLHTANPNWIKEAAKEAGKKAVRRSLNDVAEAAITQYLTTPLVAGIKGTPTSGGSKKKSKK